MKILCLSRAPLDYKGGIPTYCKNLYSSNKFDVENFSYDLSGKLKKEYKRIYSNIKEKVFPSQFIFGTIGISKKYFLEIINKCHLYQIIHIQHPDPFSALAVIFAKLKNKKIKVIVTWHANVYMNYLLVAPILLLIDLVLFYISSKIVFFTPAHLKSSKICNFKLLKAKATIIPFCIKKPRIKANIYQNKTKSIKGKSHINIISIGRLVSYKGYKYAIKAISNLGDNINYTIIGKGPLMRKLKNQILNLELQNRVKLLGEVDEESKYKYLVESDIFLFPSINQSEAYGIVQLEAMFFNLPIINTFLDNGVNFLAPNKIALTCVPKNSESLELAINKLINDEDKYKKFSSNSYENLNRFKFSNMLDKYQELFN